MAQGSASPLPRGRTPVAEPASLRPGCRAAAGAPRAPALDCTACGACCYAAEPDYIRVFAADVARMNAAARALTIDRGPYRVLGFADGRCAALAVEGQRHRCRIYAVRPDCCRWLVPGSALCRALRAERVKDRSSRRPACPSRK